MSTHQQASNKKVVLITGSSSGLGRLTAETLAQQGYVVYAAMRELSGRNSAVASALTKLSSQTSLTLKPIELDVTDNSSIETAVARIIDEQRKIDVLVNNAGIMMVGITEAYTMEQVKQQMDVNFYGPAQLDRAVIPHMRQQNSGLLIHVTSLAGRLVFPYFGMYCASKFAIEALAESYRYELSAQGIDSVIVEPGPFSTSLIASSPKPQDHKRLADYGDVAQFPDKMLSSFEDFFQSEEAIDPQVVADDIAKLIPMSHQQRPLRTVSGLDYGLRNLNTATEPFQRNLLEALGLQDMDPTSESSKAGASE